LSNRISTLTDSQSPQPSQLNVYTDALERLNASVAFNTTDIDIAVTVCIAFLFFQPQLILEFQSRLVETGAKRLAQVYTQVVAEGSSGVTPAPGSESMLSSIPSSLLPTLSPLVQFLRTLPVPTTHPSHPAALDIFATFKDAQLGYADMRGNWSVKCLEGQGKRLVARAESVDPLTTGIEFRDWVELMLGIAEVRKCLFAACIGLMACLGGI
jgi:exocyst complex protein 7